MGPLRADLLKKELSIFTFGDLLSHFPFRHIDRTQLNTVNEINAATEYVQIAGVLLSFETMGQKQGKRLVAELKDKTGVIELIWFQGLGWVQKLLQTGHSYLVYGRVSFFNNQPQIVHPEIEILLPEQPVAKKYLEPVYPTTEKLKAKGLGGRQLSKLTQALLSQIHEHNIPEILPDDILCQLNLISRFHAFRQIHFPQNNEAYEAAVRRLKFEELFISQLRMQMIRSRRHRFSKGVVFDTVGDLFNTFYKEHLPFELTGAQKRVIKEIRSDTARGKQMNRLLQGDVGSGKTIVAVLLMLLAADNGFQSCLMAPTEILSRQHFETISALLEKMKLMCRHCRLSSSLNNCWHFSVVRNEWKFFCIPFE